MNRGDLYRVAKPSTNDPKKFGIFVIVSRQVLIDSKFSTVICAPIYSRHDALSSQVLIGTVEGVKHNSSIHCDELVSLPKNFLTNFIGRLSESEIKELNQALKISLDIFD